MRKKFLGFLALLLATTLVACGSNGADNSKNQPAGGSSQVAPAKRYTVRFMNGEERVGTESVKEGESLTAAQIPTVPAPEGKQLVGWSLTEGGEIVDLTTYVVNADVTFYAVFKSVDIDESLDVNAQKEADKTYYLVMGWWERTEIKDGVPNLLSHLTENDVRIIYTNIINYVKANGATAEDIANIQFRNYSTDTVAQMVAKVNADADVDLLFGVGNNVNSSGNITLLHGNDSKFEVTMGASTPTARFVANPAFTSDLGEEIFDWLKDTTKEGSNPALTKVMSAKEIEDSIAAIAIDLTVTVHGDTDAVTKLTNKKTAITMPAITAPTGKHFVGFATSATGEVVLTKSENITYVDLKPLVAAGASTLDLYPIFENDLDVTVTVHGNTDVASHLVLDSDAITLPEFTVPEGYHLAGFALTATGEVAIEKTSGLTLADVKDLLTEGVNTLDLYPVFEANPVMAYDLTVYVQIQGTNLYDYEVALLNARFNESRTDNKKIKIEGIKVSDAQGFIDALDDKDDADVIVGGNNPVDKAAFTRHAEGPTADSGAKHFRSTRKVAILQAAETHGHLELAKEFYNFVKADAQEFEFHYSFWSNANKWTTEAERATMTTAIEARVNTYLGIKDTETLAGIYNVKITSYLATGTKVADLGTETMALRSGKGTDLVIGCGGNIDETEPGKATAGMTIVEKKSLGAPFVAASSRYVALVHENPLARDVYENYFVEQTTPEQGA